MSENSEPWQRSSTGSARTMRWGASTSRCRGSRASRCTWGKAAGSRGTCWNWSRTREKPDHTSGRSWKPRSRSWRQSRSSGLQHGRTDGRPGHPDGKRPRRRPARAPKATAEAPRRRRSRRATGRPRRAGKDWEKAKDGKGSSNGSGAGWYDWNRRTVRACHHGWRGVWWYPGQMDEEDPLWIDGAPSGSTVPWRGEDDAEGALDLEKRGSPFLRNSDKLYGCADGYPIGAAQKKFQVPVRRSAPCWKPRICFIGDPAASWQVFLAGYPGRRWRDPWWASIGVWWSESELRAGTEEMEASSLDGPNQDNQGSLSMKILERRWITSTSVMPSSKGRCMLMRRRRRWPEKSSTSLILHWHLRRKGCRGVLLGWQRGGGCSPATCPWPTPGWL